MNTFTCFILGLNKKAFKNSPREVRRDYHITVIAWVAVSLMGAFSGLDIAHNFTSNNQYLIGAAIFGSIFVGFVDWIFISGRKSGFFATAFRFVFAFLVISFTAVSAIALWQSRDINNVIQNSNSQEIAVLDSTYNAIIDNLYEPIQEQEKEVQEYHKEVCVPEAKDGYAGEIYEMKHSYCTERRDEIASERQLLEEKEEQLYATYSQERSQLKSYDAGISERFTILYNMVIKDPVKLVITGGVFLILLFFDLQSLVRKLSISKDNEYEEWREKINNDKKGEKEIGRTIDQNENVMMESVKGFESVLANKNLIAHLKKFTKKNTNLRPMAKAIITELEKSSGKVITELKKQEIYETLVSNEGDLNGIDPTHTESKKAPINKYNLFYMTRAMKKIGDRLWRKANGNGDNYSKLVFDWMKNNIKYNSDHTHEFYMTAREVFNSKMGVCGESSILFGAFMKYKNQKWYYCHVDIDNKGEKVNHACSCIEKDGSEILVDVAYSIYGISHQTWNKVSEEKLITNMISWNR